VPRASACPWVGDLTVVHAALWFSHDARTRSCTKPF